jgi:hypothetical protein
MATERRVGLALARMAWRIPLPSVPSGDSGVVKRLGATVPSFDLGGTECRMDVAGGMAVEI